MDRFQLLTAIRERYAMKKRDKKMQLHRETLRQLEPGESLARVKGALEAYAPVAVWTSCIEPNCCGGQTLDTQ